MRRSPVLAVVVLGLTASAWTLGSSETGAGDPRVVEVNMVDKSATSFVFEPAEITVRPGDTVRFRQQGVMPHNVEFRDPPAGAELDSIRMGRFLTAKGQVYDVAVDERFVAGRYPFVCTPHEPMGMKGVLTVEGAGTR